MLGNCLQIAVCKFTSSCVWLNFLQNKTTHLPQACQCNIAVKLLQHCIYELFYIFRAEIFVGIHKHY